MYERSEKQETIQSIGSIMKKMFILLAVLFIVGCTPRNTTYFPSPKDAHEAVLKELIVREGWVYDKNSVYNKTYKIVYKQQ